MMDLKFSERGWKVSRQDGDLIIVPKNVLAHRRISSEDVEAWLADPVDRQSILDACGIESATRQYTEAELRARIIPMLEDMFRRGELVAFLGTPGRTRSANGDESPEQDPVVAQANPASAPKKQAAKTFIEIELLDSDGRPVSNERYRIEAPDGIYHTGNLDAKGRARVDGIDPGECTVCFPDIDGSEWNDMQPRY